MPSAAAVSCTSSVPSGSLSMAEPLEPGDIVEYVAHPDWGRGRVRWIAPNGLVMARFEACCPVYEGMFGEGELARVESFKATA